MADLRSDTVTKPTPAMLEAMCSAKVGDDIFCEDPSVRALEDYVADLLGKDTALFMPSGTMANQIGLALHASPGETILVSKNAHILRYESGAAAGLSGIQLSAVSDSPLMTVDALSASLETPAFYTSRQAAVAFENTHNAGGGVYYEQRELDELVALASTESLGTHMDGARLWNASAASGIEPARIVHGIDTVSVCFSKGLGAPVGSALALPHSLRQRGLHLRRRLGGAMRQSGYLAAAAHYGLIHHRDDLTQDHSRAYRIAQDLLKLQFDIELSSVQTNIVMVDTRARASDLVAALEREDVFVTAFGPKRLRLVFHRDLTEQDLQVARAGFAAIAHLNIEHA